MRGRKKIKNFQDEIFSDFLDSKCEIFQILWKKSFVLFLWIISNQP